MSIRRVVNTDFWTDEKVVELFSPEDKLFMLYLLTNPHTKQLGIYKLVKKQCAFELGYSVDSVSVLLERFENKYQIIKYSNETNEVAIKNFLVHSIVKGGKPVEDCLLKDISEVKDKSLLEYVFKNLYNKENLNETVTKILSNYKEKDNDNDNDSIVDESYNESSVSKSSKPNALTREKLSVTDTSRALETKPSHTNKLSVDSGKEIISFILKDNSEFKVTEDIYNEYKQLYPDINIMQELRSLKAWCISNPSKRKTRKGALRFVNSWLSRKQGQYSNNTSNNNYKAKVEAKPAQKTDWHFEKNGVIGFGK